MYMLLTIQAFCGEISFLFQFFILRDMNIAPILEQSKHNLGADFDVIWNSSVSLELRKD